MKKLRTQNTLGWMSAALQTKIEATNRDAAQLNADREEHAIVMGRIRETASTADRLVGNGRVTGNGVQSWIMPGTFASATDATRKAEELRAERLRLPIEGLRVLGYQESLVHTARREWQAYVEALKGALEKARAAARKKVEQFKGLSDAARAVEIETATQAEAEAFNAQVYDSEMKRPLIPEHVVRWDSRESDELRVELLEELRAAFMREVG
ncbi:MAG: hypothetical protein WCI03_03665 [bacterium]